MDKNSLAHTRWECKYHIVFAPKYRRKIIYKQILGSPTAQNYTKEVIRMDKNSLAHTRWECKYHIVFAPKYRRKIIYKQIRADIGHILSELCKRKGIEIIEMFVRIPPKYSVSEIMGYLKGKSSLMIFERHADWKYKYGNRHFWCRGYYVDTVG